MADNIVELLAEAGIRLKSYQAGHGEHLRCPRCEGGRTREASLSVRIDLDGQGATWICHRGTCGWKAGARVHHDRPPPRRDRVYRPPPPNRDRPDHRPDWFWEFWDERKIGARTIEEFGVYATRRRFPDPVGDSDCIVFPYRLPGGELANRKYRPFPAKSPQLQESDPLPTLYGIDKLPPNPGTLIFVEGEPDVLACWESGVRGVVSLKDGAPAQPGDGFGSRLDALGTHEAILATVKKVILAGDMDAPGLALREEIARRVGRHRCWRVEWPKWCKDAGDTLRAHGPEAVVAAIEAAEALPIEGLHTVKPGSLLNLRHRPPPRTMTTGTSATDAILKLPAEGNLIVLTGWPSHGKTTWLRFVMIHTARTHERRWAVFSPESQPWERFVAQCAEAFMGKPFWPLPGIETLSDQEISRAEEFLRDHVTMLVCDAENETPTADWLIERATACVLRDGTTDIVIDPTNEVDQDRGDMTETDWIGRFLQRWRAFAHRHGVNVWIVAHPAKPFGGSSKAAPGPYDIAGSAHWANKPDLGLTIHSPDQGCAELHVWKSRSRMWGVRGDSAHMDYDILCGRYSTAIRGFGSADDE